MIKAWFKARFFDCGFGNTLLLVNKSYNRHRQVPKFSGETNRIVKLNNTLRIVAIRLFLLKSNAITKITFRDRITLIRLFQQILLQYISYK